MRTSTISNLKTHLSAEIKALKNGEPLIILDRRHPVASLQAFEPPQELTLAEPAIPYQYEELPPLLARNQTALDPLWDDRAGR
jgi:antitoxin (DNA-binding transcriptional repressor) of toxin-antitoxin stability system